MAITPWANPYLRCRNQPPGAGDIVILDAPSDALGTEIQGKRPALVLTPLEHNLAEGTATICPITNTSRDGRWEVRLPPSSPSVGVILCHKVMAVDWRARHATVLGTAPIGILQEVLDKLASLLGLVSP